VPYSQFIPWLLQHGLDMDLFMRELFATRIGAFFAFDVVVSALALFVFVFAERTVARVRHVWLPVVATLVVWRVTRITAISLHAATVSRCNHHLTKRCSRPGKLCLLVVLATVATDFFSLGLTMEGHRINGAR